MFILSHSTPALDFKRQLLKITKPICYATNHNDDGNELYHATNATHLYISGEDKILND